LHRGGNLIYILSARSACADIFKLKFVLKIIHIPKIIT